MRSICVLVAALSLSAFSFGQDDLIKLPPTAPSKEKFDAYLATLDSIQKVLDVKIEKLKTENEDAVNNIDKAKLAQSYQNYSQNGSPQTALALVQTQQEALADQETLNNLKNVFTAKKDSLDKAYATDMEKFNTDFTDYMTKCTGEGGTNAKCDALLAEIEQMKPKILQKYFVGDKALYVVYLTEFRTAMKDPSVNAALSAINSTELTFMGAVVFPHKDDLVALDYANSIIGLIQRLFVIDVRLWPSK
jgi:hypothetical protein